MKKNNKDVSPAKKFAHFMKHYSGFMLLALFCACLTVLVIGFCTVL